MRIPVVKLLLLGTVVCAGLLVWAAATGYRAKQCLDGSLHSDWTGISITERGCEVTTTSGELVLMPLTGPPFEVAVTAAFGLLVLGTASVVMLVRRGHRAPRSS